MANTVQGSVTVALGVTLNPTGDPTIKNRKLAYTINKALAFSGAAGGGVNAAEQIFATQQAIANSSNYDLDLAASTENDIGEALAFNNLKVLVIENTSTTGAVTLTSTGPSTPLTGLVNGTVTIPAGGILFLGTDRATGITVTGGSADTLRIANSSGGSVTVNIVAIGNV